MDGNRTSVRERWRTDAARRSLQVVASRRRALETLAKSISHGEPRPVLITGGPGIGKTWLAESFITSLTADWAAVLIHLAKSMDGVDLLRLVGDSLGVAPYDRLAPARLAVEAKLAEYSIDGRQVLLVIDDAERASADVWDELRVVADQLGRPSGFAAMLVAGHTELARATGDGRFPGAASFFKAHIHLAPLDLDEARELVGSSFVGLTLEELHRDSRGNPSVLSRLAGEMRGNLAIETAATAVAERPQIEPATSAQAIGPWDSRVLASSAATGSRARITAQSAAVDRQQPRALVPSRPPIRVEDGLVEVGWAGDLDSDLEEPETRDASVAAEPVTSQMFPAEESISDRYAALQARSEWSRSGDAVATGDKVLAHADSPLGAAGETADADGGDETDGDDHGVPERFLPESTSAGAQARVRAETVHDHGPYSELFTRLRQSR